MTFDSTRIDILNAFQFFLFMFIVAQLVRAYIQIFLSEGKNYPDIQEVVPKNPKKDENENNVVENAIEAIVDGN